MKPPKFFDKEFKAISITIVLAIALAMLLTSLTACTVDDGEDKDDTESDCGARIWADVIVKNISDGLVIPHPREDFKFNVKPLRQGMIDDIDERPVDEGGYELFEDGTEGKLVINTCDDYVIEVAYPGYKYKEMVTKFKVDVNGKPSDSVEVWLEPLGIIPLDSDPIPTPDMDVALLARCETITTESNCGIIFAFSSLADRFGNCENLLTQDFVNAGSTQTDAEDEANRDCCRIFSEANGQPLLPDLCL